MSTFTPACNTSLKLVGKTTILFFIFSHSLFSPSIFISSLVKLSRLLEIDLFVDVRFAASVREEEVLFLPGVSLSKSVPKRLWSSISETLQKN